MGIVTAKLQPLICQGFDAWLIAKIRFMILVNFVATLEIIVGVNIPVGFLSRFDVFMVQTI
ncbi:hypothetical protein CBF27_06290 [Vagococcus acidifermentans]|uniref:Uncharacterized protein n=1 Tax=Vagococcus acidifermentans TaxID=564710 RepID=A0A430AWZ8_9ENTE|nr:hypothetical protein CBF27_06290 [Vagococcus acidifermentans]